MRALSLLLLLAMLVGCGKKKPSDPETNSNPAASNNPSTNSDSGNNSDLPSEPALPVSRVPVAKLSAIELFNEYDRNPLAADRKYKGKFVEVMGGGSVHRGDTGKYTYGFTVAVFPGMTQAQLNQLTPQEKQWFREGGYPPSVVATLNSEGEDAAASLKGGQVHIVGIVRGSRKAPGWRNFVVELDDCTLQTAEKANPPKKDVPIVEMLKNDPKYEPWNEKVYNEKVIVRYWDEDKFLTPMKNVPAHRREFQGGNTLRHHSRPLR